MAMGHVFEIAFAISATLGAGFRGATTGATNQMKQLGNTAKSISAQQKQLDRAWKASAASVKNYERQLVSLRNQFDQGKITATQYQANTRRIGLAMKTAGMSAEEYRTHLQRLQQEMDKTRAAQAKLQQVLMARNSAMANFSAASSGLLIGAAKVTMMSAPIVSMIQTAANFEAAMSKVKAITSSSDQEIQQLTNQARELGEQTQFSATQAADAMSYLGMAGWNTEQIMAGMPALLNLAAAGGTDLARTADIISDDLTAFGLSAEDAGHMADVFAVAANKTNTSIEMLGETMKYAAPVAHAFGASMEETAAMAGIMANSGIKASQAGTALRSGFIRLAGPPKMARQAMEELGLSMEDITAEQKEAAMAMESLGIQMSDQNGPRKMSAILSELRDKTQNLSKEEKLATLGAIFGKEAATGWLAVLEAGPDTFNSLVDAMEHSDGAAAQMAETMNDNAKGAAIRLKSAVESLSISVGNIFLPTIAKGADTLAAWAGGLSKVAAAHPGVIEGMMGIAGAAVGLFAYVKISNFLSSAFKLLKAQYEFIKTMQLAEKFAKIGQAMAKIGPIAMRMATTVGGAMLRLGAAMMANPAGLVIIGIVAVIAALYLLYKNFDKVREGAANAWKSISTGAAGAWNSLTGSVSSAWGKIKAGASSAWASLKNGVSAAGAGIKNGLMKVVGFYVNFYTSLPGRIAFAIGFIVGVLRALPGKIASMVTAAGQWLRRLPSICLAAGSAFIAAAASWLSAAYSSVVSWIGNMIEGAATFLMKLPGRCMAAGSAFIAAASAWLSEAYETAVSWMSNLVQGVYNFLVQLPEYCAEAGAAFVDAASQWASEAYDTVVNWIKQIPGAISKTLSGAWEGIKREFSEGITVGVHTVTDSGGGDEPDENARGGIYSRGAFLTWFAEDSDEAAIPLDGSPRAIGLWKRAGMALGFNTDEIEPERSGQKGPNRTIPATVRPRIQRTPGITIQQEDQAPTAPNMVFNMNFYGETQPKRVESAVKEAAQQARQSFAEQLESYRHERRRVSFGY